jgi:DNA-binding HxlR family transcriptional regulator
MPKQYTPPSVANDVEAALHLLEGRWKLVILFHLFGGKVMRFSDLERAIPAISQKMLGQQLRRLEADGIVVRTVYPEIPPRVEYRLTEWGQTLCPALDAILTWADQRPQLLTDRVEARHSTLDAPAESPLADREPPLPGS